MTKRHKIEIIVGAFALLGFILLIIITMNIKQWFIFAQTYNINVFFKRVSGLEVGAQVYVFGVPAGEVKAIEYTPGEKLPVKVVLSIRRNIKIYSNAIVQIVTAGLIGETKIEILAGTPDHPQLNHGDSINGAAMVDLYQALSYAPDVMEDVSKTIRLLREIFEEEQTRVGIRQTITNLGSLTTRLDDLLTTTSADIATITGNLSDVAKRMSQLVEDLQQLVKDVRSDLQETKQVLTTGIQDLTAEANRVGTDVSNAATSIHQTSTKLNELLTARHSELSQTIENLQSATDQLKQILSRINEGKGTMGHLVNDPELYYELRDTMRRLREILAGISQDYMQERLYYEHLPAHTSPSDTK